MSELSEVKEELKNVNKRLSRIEKKQQKTLDEETKVERAEEKELVELEELEKLEAEIEKNTAPHPLAKLTYKDITKGIIGSFFGIVGHFAFFYGSKIAYDLSLARAHTLLLTSLVILILFIYFSGFRKIKKQRKFSWIPLRVIVIYSVAHIVIGFVLFLFGVVSADMSLAEIYKNMAAVSILAVMGAATADLIGGE